MLAGSCLPDGEQFISQFQATAERFQLSAFDEQLAALEQMLGPLAEWSKTWADFEQRMLNMGFKPEAGKIGELRYCLS